MKKQLVLKINDLKQFNNTQLLVKAELKYLKGGSSESIVDVDVIEG